MSTVFNRPTLRPVTVCGRTIPEATHICAFFDSSQQEYDCLVPYFTEGLAQGEQVVTIRDAGKLEEHCRDLQERIPHDLGDAERTKQFRALASEETYLKEGFFGAERMGLMLEEVLREAEASPFKRVRTCGDMTWALRDMPGTDELMEYESRVNTFTRDHDCTLMCVYDVNKFSGRAVMDVLATHPMVVMGDRVYENQYYEPPESLLKKMLRRGSAPLARTAEIA
jgi:DcmR-like sensory protein